MRRLEFEQGGAKGGMGEKGWDVHSNKGRTNKPSYS